MSSRSCEKNYGSHLEFYQNAYGHAVREVRIAGRSGASLIWAEQDAGDWSDAATPDLVIGRTVRHHGSAKIDVGAGRFAINGAATGSFLVIAPSFATTFLVEAPHTVQLLALPYAGLLDLAGSASGLPSDGDFGALHRMLIQDAEIGGLIDRLWLESGRGNPYGSLLAQGLVIQLAAALLRLKNGQTFRHAGGLTPRQLKRVQDLLEARIDQDTSLSFLAGEVCLSEAHLSRAFKASTGLPPWRWLAERRIERAKTLLADPRLSLTDVAQMVGFSGQNTFGEAFRRMTGMTPGRYRRSLC